MADGPDLVELLEARSSHSVRALLDEHPTDTTDRTARDWLKRWGPAGLAPKPPACTCATGRCRICN